VDAGLAKSSRSIYKKIFLLNPKVFYFFSPNLLKSCLYLMFSTNNFKMTVGFPGKYLLILIQVILLIGLICVLCSPLFAK
jgi:small-conductance mechanosensitive channel